MRVEQHKKARMETLQHGKFVPEEISKGGLYLVRTLKDCKGIEMMLMLEEKTRTVNKFEGGVCARTGVN